MKITKMLLSGILMVGCLTGAAQASTWSQQHPRRAEVLRRDNRSLASVNAARCHDNLTRGQARQLRHEDVAIRRQEQRDAAINGGYITKGQQRFLNREENGVNRQMRRDEWVDSHSARP